MRSHYLDCGIITNTAVIILQFLAPKGLVNVPQTQNLSDLILSKLLRFTDLKINH